MDSASSAMAASVHFVISAGGAKAIAPEGETVRGVLEDWRTMGPTEPVRSASHAVLRQLRESKRQQKLRDKTQKTQGQTGLSETRK